MASEDLQTVNNLTALGLIVTASKDRQSVLNDQAEQKFRESYESAEERIPNSLWFRKMDERQNEVRWAAPATFEWALEPPAPDCKWDNLSTWLQSGSGIYWICGKAASGKSTLMKHILYHKKTQDCLRMWACERRLTTASFFFRSLGDENQKSHTGLSQALLHKILVPNRTLIPKLLPTMWREASNSPTGILSLPSAVEIKQAFHSFSRLQHEGNAFCFLVDGLDEYEGNYTEAISLLQTLASSPNVKVLLSSRPIAACFDAFGRNPRLQLQDLNESDIRTYVSARFSSHPYFRGLAKSSPDHASDIVEELVGKSSGVFLWVVLACSSLRDGFIAFDSLSELRCRVDELPPELEAMFQHILDGVEVRYRRHAAKFILIMYHARMFPRYNAAIMTLPFTVLDEDDLNLTDLPKLTNLHLSEKHAKCEILEGRIRNRCAELLEIVKPKVKAVVNKAPKNDFGEYLHSQYEPRPGLSCCCNSENHHDELVDSRLDFIHRTVLEFLNAQQKAKIKQFSLQAGNCDFASILCCLYLQTAWLSGEAEASNVYHLEFTTAFFNGAHEVPPTSADDLYFLLGKFEEMAKNMVQNSRHPFFSELGLYAERKRKNSLLSVSTILSIEAGLDHVAIPRLNLETVTCDTKKLSSEFPPLYYAVATPHLKNISNAICQNDWVATSLSIIRQLLGAGSDPNETMASLDDETPWRCWIKRVISLQALSTVQSQQVIEAIAVWAQAGADTEDLDDLVGRGLTSWIRGRFLPTNDSSLSAEVARITSVLAARRTCTLRLMEGDTSSLKGQNKNASEDTTHLRRSKKRRQSPSPPPKRKRQTTSLSLLRCRGHGSSSK